MKIETEPKQKKHKTLLCFETEISYGLPVYTTDLVPPWPNLECHQKETHGNRTSAAVICRSRNKTQLFETTYSCRSQESHNHFCLHDLSPLK